MMSNDTHHQTGQEPKFDELPPPTAPDNISVQLRCFDTEDHARNFGNLVATYVRELSRRIDLSGLDGITISYDYAQALLDLDRGYETSHRLTPSTRLAIGVAMTPVVIRDGVIKSHMLFNAAAILALEDLQHELHGQALHLLAHECAHVEVTERFNTAFPGVLLQRKVSNLHAHCRWEIIKACWDEYAVTQICAGFGTAATDGYEETFIEALADARPHANGFIQAYRLHRNLEQVMSEVYGAYGNLMKFAAYHLGNMAGLELSVDDLPWTKQALAGHWFAPHFNEMQKALSQIAADYGRWTTKDSFEAVGDLADKVVAEGGLIVADQVESGSFAVDIPFSLETMPPLR